MRISERWLCPWRILRLLTLGLAMIFVARPHVGLAADGPSAAYPIVVMIKGTVEVAEAPGADFHPARTNQVLKAGYRLRTMEHSRATLLMSDQSTLEVGELGLFEVPLEQSAGLGFLRGLFYFFHRDKPGVSPVRTPTSYSLIRGTEFHVEVKGDGTTILTMFDGAVEMENPMGRLSLTGNQQAIVEPGQGPRRTAVLFGVDIIQWALYYPGVLRLEDLAWDSPPEEVRESMAAYATGDLPAALERYPAGRAPASDHEKVYLAGLLLSMGLVERSQSLIESLPKNAQDPASARLSRLGQALIETMAAVKFQDFETGRQPELASEWLARSYYWQSRSDLKSALANALAAALQSVEAAPDFGFGWARVAELEFGFGQTRRTRDALERALRLSPRNAQAVALEGFVLAAENRIDEGARSSAETLSDPALAEPLTPNRLKAGLPTGAMQWFDQAIAIDGALGNAWLGRGLCRIRRGDAEGGRRDLLVAATLEPQRALLRSYLGKAYNQEGELGLAAHELELAKRLDPNDPTAWLYSALLNQQRNLINDAVRDLEQSKALNENRSLYRSRLLLDQDRAVRGANLANVYLDAGLEEVSAREAVQAINADYANYSAHQFLANTYGGLRDPGQVNLRYETPFLSEYLVANLLAPAAAGTLSPQVTQQEYSRLFERDQLGLASATEYYSRGDWVQSVAQYGIWGSSAYSAEVAYRTENGDRRNSDLEQVTLNLRVKQELTPADSVYVQAVYYNAESGDLAQRYDPDRVNTTVRVKERQEPIVLLGYHHQWAPGSHSLLLAGRIDDTVLVDNRLQGSLLFDRFETGFLSNVVTTVFDQKYRSELELYTLEGQQIFQSEPHALIVGARYQRGEFDTENSENNLRFPGGSFPLSDRQDESPDLSRANAYAYWHWRILPPFLAVAGLSYDWVRYPVNHRFGPVTDAEEEHDKVSPKAGFIWTPLDHSTVRFAYTRSLGGVSLDQSFRLEPTQVAGFNQAYRSLIPESAAGVSPVPEFETWGVSLEQKFGSGTYLGLAYDWLGSEERRDIGIYEAIPTSLIPTAATTPQRLDYREQSGTFTVHQLLGQGWSAGVRYRLSHADLDQRFDAIPGNVTIISFPDPDTGGPTFFREQHLEGLLHQANLFALYQHPCGFFSRVDALWTMQDNDGYSPARPGDDFWQFNAFVGYRFWRRRAEARLGVLNLADQDYQINPLNLTARLPRDRTLAASFRFVF